MLKPFSGEDFFSRGIRNTRSRSCSFLSAKGRSGKIALSIVQQTGDLVAIIDADLQFSDMAIFFDVEPVTTIVEATRDIKFLSPRCPSPKIFRSCVDRAGQPVVRMAQTLFHYVLIS